MYNFRIILNSFEKVSFNLIPLFSIFRLLAVALNGNLRRFTHFKYKSTFLIMKRRTTLPFADMMQICSYRFICKNLRN